MLCDTHGPFDVVDVFHCRKNTKKLCTEIRWPRPKMRRVVKDVHFVYLVGIFRIFKPN